MKLDEYKKQFEEIVLEKETNFSSPTSITTYEQTQVFQQYRDRTRVLQLAEASSAHAKQVLKMFLRENRFRQVEVVLNETEMASITITVLSVGRDFFIGSAPFVTWYVPFASIKEVRNPNGLPSYTNSHEYMYYDNHLREKLLQQFSKTITQNVTLRHVFCEDRLETYLSFARIRYITIYGVKKELAQYNHGSFFVKGEERSIEDSICCSVNYWQQLLNFLYVKE